MLVVLQELPYDNPYNQSECYQTDVCKFLHLPLKKVNNHSENLFQEIENHFENGNPIFHCFCFYCE